MLESGQLPRDSNVSFDACQGLRQITASWTPLSFNCSLSVVGRSVKRCIFAVVSAAAAAGVGVRRSLGDRSRQHLRGRRSGTIEAYRTVCRHPLTFHAFDQRRMHSSPNTLVPILCPPRAI